MTNEIQNKFRNLVEILETITPHSDEIKKYLLAKQHYNKKSFEKNHQIEIVKEIQNDVLESPSEKNLIVNNGEAQNQILETFLKENKDIDLDIETILKKLDEIEDGIKSIKNEDELINKLEKEKNNKEEINKKIKEEKSLKDKEKEAVKNEKILKDKEEKTIKDKKNKIIKDKEYEEKETKEEKIKTNVKNELEKTEKEKIEKELINKDKEAKEKEQTEEKKESLNEVLGTRKNQDNIEKYLTNNTENNNINFADHILKNQNKIQEAKNTLKAVGVENPNLAKEKISELENKSREIQALINQIISTGGTPSPDLLAELSDINSQKGSLSSAIDILSTNQMFK